VKSKVAWDKGGASLTFEPTPEDPMVRGHASLTGRSMRIKLPVRIGRKDVHPDLEALAVVLVVSPFAGGTLTVNRPVSTAMEVAVARAFKFRIQPVDPELAPRARPTPGTPALAFSGGVDSSAALLVLPDHTVLGFMRRIPLPGGESSTLYREAAALHACASLQVQGRTVHIYETDMEYIRNPVGFPTDWANASGLVLLADHLRLDSISWGLVAESAYRIGHEVYKDWASRRAAWSRIFAAAGLHFNAPVAGVSEVGTTTIVAASPIAGIVQSCIRGGVGAPCGNCWKCFRKSMLDAARSGNWPADEELDRLFAVRDVKRTLAKFPIPHEDVIGWIAGRYPGKHPKMRLLRERAVPQGQTFSWLERWYSPSAELLDARVRDVVEARLDRHMGRMTAEDEAEFQAWDMTAWLADPATRAAAEALVPPSSPPSAPDVSPAGPPAPLAGPPPAPSVARDPAAPRPARATAGGKARNKKARKKRRPRWRRAISRLVRTLRGAPPRAGRPLDRGQPPGPPPPSPPSPPPSA
jgi:hypothetical protein